MIEDTSDARQPRAGDHYATLGVGRRCTALEIRNAYRTLVKQHHPDVNPASAEAAERAQEINAAHDVLSDPAKRREYDRELDAARPSSGRYAGKIERNVAQDVSLRIEDFLQGSSLDVRVNDPGNLGEAETYRLEVPAMTAPGTRFRLPRPAPFAGGFVTIRARVLPGFRFKARGSDLRCDLKIRTQLVANGGTETITGATGRPLRIEVPAGVRRGEVLRVSGEGLPKPRGGRGDLLVRVTYRPEVRVTRAR